MAEVIFKLVCSSFYLFVEPFDSIPIPVCGVLELEAMATECVLKPWCSIDEKYGAKGAVFLAKFAKEEF